MVKHLSGHLQPSHSCKNHNPLGKLDKMQIAGDVLFLDPTFWVWGWGIWECFRTSDPGDFLSPGCLRSVKPSQLERLCPLLAKKPFPMDSEKAFDLGSCELLSHPTSGQSTSPQDPNRKKLNRACPLSVLASLIPHPKASPSDFSQWWVAQNFPCSTVSSGLGPGSSPFANGWRESKHKKLND